MTRIVFFTSNRQPHSANLNSNQRLYAFSQ